VEGKLFVICYMYLLKGKILGTKSMSQDNKKGNGRGRTVIEDQCHTVIGNEHHTCFEYVHSI
jgi:hypothetical protein